MYRYVIISFAFILNSCAYQKVPITVKQTFSYCIMNDSLYNNNKFDLTGYYEFFRYIKNENNEIILKDSTSSNRYFFFKDGTFMIIRHPKRNLESNFEEMISYVKQGKKHPGYYNTDWGAYRLFGDTIKAQYMNHKSFMAENRMYLFEEWFFIQNYNTIQHVGGKYLVAYNGGELVVNKKPGFIDKYSSIQLKPATFVPVKNIPPPNSWLKNEKWFWCNEKDYMEWQNK